MASKINFVYTGPVWSPVHLVGQSGDVRRRTPADAELLKRQGYGYIEADGPPVKPAPPDPDADLVARVDEPVIKSKPDTGPAAAK